MWYKEEERKREREEGRKMKGKVRRGEKSLIFSFYFLSPLRTLANGNPSLSSPILSGAFGVHSSFYALTVDVSHPFSNMQRRESC